MEESHNNVSPENNSNLNLNIDSTETFTNFYLFTNGASNKEHDKPNTNTPDKINKENDEENPYKLKYSDNIPNGNIQNQNDIDIINKQNEKELELEEKKKIEDEKIDKIKTDFYDINSSTKEKNIDTLEDGNNIKSIQKLGKQNNLFNSVQVGNKKDKDNESQTKGLITQIIPSATNNSNDLNNLGVLENKVTPPSRIENNELAPVTPTPLSNNNNNDINNNNENYINKIKNSIQDEISLEDQYRTACLKLNINLDNPKPKNLKNEENINIINFRTLKEHPCIGLKNLGNTCYMNSVLQCLCNSEHLIDFFLNPKNIEYLKQYSEQKIFSFLLSNIMTNLWSKRIDKIFDPQHFYFKLCEKNNLFKNGNFKDPIELLRFLFFILNKELNNGKPYNADYYKNIDQTNENEVLLLALTKYKAESNSILFDRFSWFSEKKIQCFRCNKIKYAFNNFLYFEVDFLEAIDYLKTKGVKDIKQLSLENCLDSYCKKYNIIETFCEKCKERTQHYIKNSLYTVSSIFTILIDRKLSNNINQNIQFQIDEYLDMSNYSIFNNKAVKNYELFGVVSLIELKSKFIAFCKSPLNKKWYLYEDENVKETFISDIKKKGIPYILFYKISK